jgi:hypothetical protein
VTAGSSAFAVIFCASRSASLSVLPLSRDTN